MVWPLLHGCAGRHPADSPLLRATPADYAATRITHENGWCVPPGSPTIIYGPILEKYLLFWTATERSTVPYVVT